MLILTPDLEIPFIDPNDQDFDKLTLRERAEVAVKTINILGSAGAEFEDDYEDLAVARDIIRGEEKLDEKLLSKNPGAIAHVQRLLSEYEEQVVVEAARLRNYVTNKLILESDDNDARIRIRALELLGKISDVGLFTEKSEITYKTKSDEELDEELEKRIQSILSKNTIDITPEEVFGSARERSPFTKQNSQPQAAQ
jgi:hypothetical protein